MEVGAIDTQSDLVEDIEATDGRRAGATADKSRRIIGAERQVLADDLVKRYSEGESIRALASATGRSYGFVHRVLTENGVSLRQRGGARKRRIPHGTDERAATANVRQAEPD